MKTTVKTLDVQAKEWFDKVNGNSYFSGRITINFGMGDEKTIYMPFQYGYGDHYRHMAFEQLQKEGYLSSAGDRVSHWQYYQDHGIVARHSKQENCKKRDVLNYIIA